MRLFLLISVAALAMATTAFGAGHRAADSLKIHRAGDVASLAKQTVRLRGRVGYLAADRGRVALGVFRNGMPPGEIGDWPTIGVWDPGQRSITWFPTTVGRKHSYLGKLHVFLSGLGLAGSTVAWLGQVWLGEHETPRVVVRARLGRMSKPQIAAFTSSVNCCTGYALGNFHSGGSRITFDTYYACDLGGDFPDPRPACATLSPLDNGTLETEVLAMDTGTAGTCASIRSGGAGADFVVRPLRTVRCKTIIQTSGGAPLLAVYGDNVVLGRPDGSIELLGASGATLATVASTQGTIRAVALDAQELVLLVRTGPGQALLEVHDLNSGTLESTLPVPGSHASMGSDACDYADIDIASFGCDNSYPRLRLDSAAKGIVVYATNQTLHALRISDQRDVTIAHSVHGSALHAQLDQSGLFYSFDVKNRRYPGRVVHLSWKALDQLLTQSQ
jgi:hypothetical protein